jgi:hypothetical protein
MVIHIARLSLRRIRELAKYSHTEPQIHKTEPNKARQAKDMHETEPNIARRATDKHKTE